MLATVGERYPSKRYGTEIAAGFVMWYFAHSEKEKLVARVEPLNNNSIRMLNRLGFRKVDEQDRCYPGRGAVHELIYELRRPAEQP